jgi:hypothetical protein
MHPLQPHERPPPLRSIPASPQPQEPDGVTLCLEKQAKLRYSERGKPPRSKNEKGSLLTDRTSELKRRQRDCGVLSTGCTRGFPGNKRSKRTLGFLPESLQQERCSQGSSPRLGYEKLQSPQPWLRMLEGLRGRKRIAHEASTAKKKNRLQTRFAWRPQWIARCCSLSRAARRERTSILREESEARNQWWFVLGHGANGLNNLLN